jgi:excisionase family DNA binding protein
LNFSGGSGFSAITNVAVALRLTVSKATAYQLVSSGKLPCYRVGVGRGAIRVREEDLQRYLDGSLAAVPIKQPPVKRQALRHIRLP